VPSACVAAGVSTSSVVASSAAFGVSTFDVVVAAYSSWWCSNGLYKTVTDITSAAGASNISTIIPFSNNKRLELAQVACPQSSGNCGTAVITSLTSSGAATEI